MVGFCCIGRLMLLRVMGVGFENTCTVSGKWNVSRVIPRLYGWVYRTWRLFPLVDEHSVAVVIVGFQSRLSQIVSYGWSILDFRFIKFVFRISGRIRFRNPGWGLQYTSSLSSITVRMEYLFAFQFWYCELCVENRWRRRELDRKHCSLNFFSLALL